MDEIKQLSEEDFTFIISTYNKKIIPYYRFAQNIKTKAYELILKEDCWKKAEDIDIDRFKSYYISMYIIKEQIHKVTGMLDLYRRLFINEFLNKEEKKAFDSIYT